MITRLFAVIVPVCVLGLAAAVALAEGCGAVERHIIASYDL